MLPQNNRLKAKEIKPMYDKGIKLRGEYGMLIVSREIEGDESQWAFVVSKKIGNAVARHRMTRLLREIAKKNIGENIKGFKFVYVAFKYCDNYERLEKEFTSQINDSIRVVEKS